MTAHSYSLWPSNRQLSGNLAEEFCLKHLGVQEPQFEIKSASRESRMVIIKSWQLLRDLHKQYAICVYDRRSRRVTRGIRKGRKTYAESIKSAYARQISIYVILGFDLLDIVEREFLRTCVVRSKKVAWNWCAYYRIPLKCLPDNLVRETNAFKMYGEELKDTDDPLPDEVPF